MKPLRMKIDNGNIWLPTTVRAAKENVLCHCALCTQMHRCLHHPKVGSPQKIGNRAFAHVKADWRFFPIWPLPSPCLFYKWNVECSGLLKGCQQEQGKMSQPQPPGPGIHLSSVSNDPPHDAMGREVSFHFWISGSAKVLSSSLVLSMPVIS